MGNNVDPLKLGEALDCIRQHFMKPGGLLEKLEQGEGVYEADVRELETAFQAIRDTWEEKTLVPKEAVRLFRLVSDSISRLEQTLQLYPQLEDEIERVISHIHQWIDMPFLSSLESEEAAFALVCQHLFGTHPFVTDLLMGEINEVSLKDLLSGLSILAEIWRPREHISKLAAFAMLTTPRDFEEAAELFSEEQRHHLQEAQQQVMDSIARCLE